MRGSRPTLRRPGKVCTTLTAATGEELAEKAASAFALGTDLVEFRIDMLKKPGLPEAMRLDHLARRSVMTVRRREEGGGFQGSEAERLALIAGLSSLRPLYLDIEVETVLRNREWFAGLGSASRTIVSWHDFSGTPGFSTLKRARARAGSAGDIAKVVTTAKTVEDSLRVLRLYEEDPTNLIAFCMGAAGSVSRMLGFQLGSPLVYASLPNEPVAPGQLSVTTVTEFKKMWGGRRW